MDKHQRCAEEGCQVKEAKGYRDCEQSSGCCNLLDCSPEAQLHNSAALALTKLKTLAASLPHTSNGDDLAEGCNTIRVVLEEVVRRTQSATAATPRSDAFLGQPDGKIGK